MSAISAPHDVLDHWASRFASSPRQVTVERVGIGLINDTWWVGEELVLQRLHPIFDASVNDDIAALVPVLRKADVPVPELVRTDSGASAVTIETNERTEVWRVLSRLPGTSLDAVRGGPRAEAAGRTLARFHAALLSCDHEFHFTRVGVHDTMRHMVRLWHALERHKEHRLYDGVALVAEGIFALYDQFGDSPDLPERVIHGDPKISNFLFDENGVVTGVIDLDTMGRSSIDVELGDALRSWCASSHENEVDVVCRVDIFRAALYGYLAEARDWITEEEVASLPDAGQRISFELASRFATDALEEAYFGWNPDVAPTRGEHNLIRAIGQLNLAQDFAARSDELRGIVEQLVARGQTPS